MVEDGLISMMKGVSIGALVTVAAIISGILLGQRSAYIVSVMLPSATNLQPGGQVQIQGFKAGTVQSIEPVDGQAKITLALDSRYTPLHDGAAMTVNWKALVGERHLSVNDGPITNARVPSGGMIKGRMPQPMELDQVLAALDPPTREALKGTVTNLDKTVGGHEKNVHDTLQSAGPALQQLGGVVRGLGTDGPAISALVTQTDNMVEVLSKNGGDVRNTIGQLSNLTTATVQQRQALGEALHKLPRTLQTANHTLGTVPDTVDKTKPLLDDLRPATEKLPSTAANLRPVLTDLRPVTAQLRPTLGSAQHLLQQTPGLLDRTHDVLPRATQLVSGLEPAVDFLRPYTPETAGMFANWSSAMANYGGNGHYARLLAEEGLSSVNANPGVTPPGFAGKAAPPPGDLAGQPWTDATGGGVK